MKKTTKISFVLSCMLLVLSACMLVGTTFAWFTDSASTGVNKIMSGNLDLEVTYQKQGETTWEDIEGSTDLFKGALWEPGYVEVVYLKALNKGTLALNYRMAVSVVSEVVGVNVFGNELRLSEHLKYSLVVSEAPIAQFATREEALAAAVQEHELNTYSNNIILNADEARYYALIIHMPETVGNEANYEGVAPEIGFKVEVIATQASVEVDSFSNNYDGEAIVSSEYMVEAARPVVVFKNAVELDSEMKSVAEVSKQTGNTIVTYPEDAKFVQIPGFDAGDIEQGFKYVGSTSAHSGITVQADEALSVYDLVLSLDQTNTVLVKIETKIAKNLTVEKIYHEGVEIQKLSSIAQPTEEAFYYDSADGTLVLWVYHASELALVLNEQAPVFTMFPNVNATILSEVVGDGETVLVDEVSKTKAVIPAAALEQGVVKAGQKIYLVIKTTYNAENKATYDISLRDANGMPFAWNTNCCPSVTYDMGDMSAAVNYSIYDDAAGMYLPYGKNASPGWYYDAETGLTTITSITFR